MHLGGSCLLFDTRVCSCVLTVMIVCYCLFVVVMVGDCVYCVMGYYWLVLFIRFVLVCY